MNNYFYQNYFLMATKQMTVKEYAELRGCSKTAIFKKFHAGKTLPGVKSFELVGSGYILKVDEALAKKNLVGNRKLSKLAS